MVVLLLLVPLQVCDALHLLPHCIKYMKGLRDRDVFRFCAIPQIMAIGTLALCYNNGQVFEGETLWLAAVTDALQAAHVHDNTIVVHHASVEGPAEGATRSTARLMCFRLTWPGTTKVCCQQEHVVVSLGCRLHLHFGVICCCQVL